MDDYHDNDSLGSHDEGPRRFVEVTDPKISIGPDGSVEISYTYIPPHVMDFISLSVFIHTHSCPVCGSMVGSLYDHALELGDDHSTLLIHES